jgi:hypothetical protein
MIGEADAAVKIPMKRGLVLIVRKGVRGGGRSQAFLNTPLVLGKL